MFVYAPIETKSVLVSLPCDTYIYRRLPGEAEIFDQLVKHHWSLCSMCMRPCVARSDLSEAIIPFFGVETCHVGSQHWVFFVLLARGYNRVKFDQWMRALDNNHVMPDLEEGETIFEYYVNLGTFEWEK